MILLFHSCFNVGLVKLSINAVGRQKIVFDQFLRARKCEGAVKGMIKLTIKQMLPKCNWRKIAQLHGQLPVLLDQLSTYMI